MKTMTVLKPRLSEKTYSASQALNVYVFDVSCNVNKNDIVQAVQAQFDVTVTNVRTARIKGKTKRTFRKKLRPVSGKRSDIKKAYVTLKQGDSLPVFADIEEAEAKAQKTEKLAKRGSK